MESLSSSLDCWVCPESCGMNLMRYAITPKKHCISCLHLGKGMPLIALTFSGSGEICFPDTFCRKNINLVGRKIHLSLFNFKPDFLALFEDMVNANFYLV